MVMILLFEVCKKVDSEKTLKADILSCCRHESVKLVNLPGSCSPFLEPVNITPWEGRANFLAVSSSLGRGTRLRGNKRGLEGSVFMEVPFQHGKLVPVCPFAQLCPVGVLQILVEQE